MDACMVGWMSRWVDRWMDGSVCPYPLFGAGTQAPLWAGLSGAELRRDLGCGGHPLQGVNQREAK